MDISSFEPYLKLIAALVIALPVAWDRERNSKIMGLRTFPLVSLGACAYVLISQSILGIHEPDATARIIQGLMTGIGFVGGGAILKSSDHVAGTASAASIWVTGAVGAAVGFGFWDYAIALSVLNFLVVIGMTRLKPAVANDQDD